MLGFGKKDLSDDQENVSSNPWGAQFGEALSDARKSGVGRKARAKADKDSGEGSSSGSGVSKEAQQKLAKMFEPEKWKPIVRAPFSLAKAKTGRDLWDLKPKEEETLAETTSAAAEHFIAIDPKYLVLTLLVFNWAVIVADKVGQNNRARAQELRDNPPSSPEETSFHPMVVK